MGSQPETQSRGRQGSVVMCGMSMNTSQPGEREKGATRKRTPKVRMMMTRKDAPA